MNLGYDLARVTTATTGTGTITLGAAVVGYLTFAQAGVPTGATVSYGIADGANSEAGWGVYTAAGLTLTRNVYRSTGAGNNTAIALSGAAQVFITGLAEDFAALYSTNGILESDGAGGIGAATPDQDYAIPTWAVDLDFTTGIYGVLPYNPTNAINCSRASTGYVDDLAGVWTSVAANVLRRSNKGALIEEGRTNSIRNNSMQGAVAASPGTLPTNWTVTAGNAGLTRTISLGTENGVDYIDMRFNGTSTATSVQILPEAVANIAAVSGQAWANSMFISLPAGAKTNITGATLAIAEYSAASAFLANTALNNFLAAWGAPQARYNVIGTLGNASTAFVTSIITISFANGAVLDFTIRMGWPQLERGASATSPIRTTSVAVARAADVTTLVLPPAFGPAISIAATGTPTAPATYAVTQFLLSVDDGTNTNRIQIARRNVTNNAQAYAGGVDGTKLDTGASLAVWAQNTSGSVATGGDSVSYAASFNGSAPLISTTAGANPAITIVHIGCATNGLSAWNGYIARGLIWPRNRLGNPLFAAISAAMPLAGALPVGGVRGTNTNDDAAAGLVGEYMSNSVSALGLTSTVAANVGALTLTAGDWQVWGGILFTPAGTTTTTRQTAAIHTVSATVPTSPNSGAFADDQASYAAGLGSTLPAGMMRLTVAAGATQLVYLVARATFATSTLTASGFLAARRMR